MLLGSSIHGKASSEKEKRKREPGQHSVSALDAKICRHSVSLIGFLPRRRPLITSIGSARDMDNEHLSFSNYSCSRRDAHRYDMGVHWEEIRSQLDSQIHLHMGHRLICHLSEQRARLEDQSARRLEEQSLLIRLGSQLPAQILEGNPRAVAPLGRTVFIWRCVRIIPLHARCLIERLRMFAHADDP
jgi:hypothetical protein